ncbi:hypothetical protein BO86DRAFT_389871 [Aspergillus japonicus CBS 114.51]|uniref:Secreted protein n=1 Tax=Aspergillus japonicus CBS 114.51 TaxID=1448312 RepID=A0A8T8WYF8_ASPJA|nr:hypothetical protein BO86DRAFT_389871 [Aspergillus japonicus CBS 114.51]RAH80906.1 hypothetical protein BO86DRAFT_389871 [Aspergillus japonicus CBS 114.51]
MIPKSPLRLDYLLLSNLLACLLGEGERTRRVIGSMKLSIIQSKTRDGREGVTRATNPNPNPRGWGAWKLTAS